MARRDEITAELERLADEPAEPSIIVKRSETGDYDPAWDEMIRARVASVTVRPVGRGGNRTPVEQRVTISWREGVFEGTAQ